MFRRALFIVAAYFSFSAVAAQDATTPYNCFPTCSEVDGRMLSLAGAGLKTLGGDFINVQIISDGSGFELGIFDGDTLGGGPNSGGVGHWDRLGGGELNVTQLNFRLFADPDGDGTGTTEVGLPGGWLSNVMNPTTGMYFSSFVNGVPSGVMPDNDWFDIVMVDAPPAAANAGSECPAGHFCYRLRVTLIPDLPMVGPRGATESSFKIRSTGEIALRPLAFSFVGALRSFNDAAIIYPRFPDLSQTTYDGSWRFVMQLEHPAPFFTVWGGDFDYGSYDCVDKDTNDPDTCMNSDPESTCVANSNPDPDFFGQMVPPWADGTFARSEGVAIGNVLACGATTGAPNDDENPMIVGPPCATDGMGNPTHCFFTRFPSVIYRLDTPIGSFLNSNPSGNQEWEQFRLETDPNEPADFYVDNLPPGQYIINYSGLDLANLNALRMSAPVVGVPSASIGDRVWLDRNANGEQDPGEEGINGVEVRLYRDSNGDGMLDPATDQLIATQTTSGDGDYDFLGLGADNYFVDVVESTLPPLNLNLTTGNEPYDLPDGPYSLEESEDHNDADFGYIYGTIGDLVWSDNNGDGIFQPEFGEFGIEGVLLELRVDNNNDGIFETVVATDTTDFSGLYLFDELFVPELYRVVVAASNFGPGGPLQGASQTFDLDGLLDNQTDIDLDLDLPDGLVNLDADFGYVRPCSECDGKVRQMTLRYLGTSPAFVEVFQKKEDTPVFSGMVGPKGYFRVIGIDKKGTLGTEIQIYVNGALHTKIHTSCSQPIGPGLVSGNFMVVEAYSRNGGLICPLEGPPPDQCGECSGKVTQLTLQYTGASAALVEVFQKKPEDRVFSGMVAPGGTFTFNGTDKKGTLGTEIRIYVNGHFHTSIHTSCSQPIGPGLQSGDFLVVEGYSRNGGLLCPLDGGGGPPPPPPAQCDECDGKVTQLTLQYTGASTALVEVFQKKPEDRVFSGMVSPGETFTFSGTDKKGTLGTEIRIYVNGQLQTSIHTSCSQPIGPGLQRGDFLVVEGYSRNGGLLCPLDGGGGPPPPPPAQCDQCDGKVTELTLRYIGMSTVMVDVVQKKPEDMVFSGLVAPGASFSFTGTDKKGTLGTEIRIYVNGRLHTSIHTSCSQPIGPGLQSGDFVVVEGYSRNGGLLCSLP